MWFFMILAYVLITISGAGLILIGINHYVHIWPDQHITLDLFVSIVFMAAQTLVIFYFVGTGVNIKEYVQERPHLSREFYQQILTIKRSLYPPTLILILGYMVMVILDGAYFLGRVSEWWFHGLYPITLFYYLKATRAQHNGFKDSTRIVLDMTGSDR